MFSARLDETVAAAPSPSAVLPSAPYSELHDASFHSAGHPASPEPSSSESSDILSALSPTAEVVEQKNSNPPVTQPLTTEERAHQLELSAAYGVERAKLEIELQAYQKDPPTSEYGRKRVEELSRGIQELDQAAVKRMQDLNPHYSPAICSEVLGFENPSSK